MADEEADEEAVVAAIISPIRALPEVSTPSFSTNSLVHFTLQGRPIPQRRPMVCFCLQGHHARGRV